MNRQIQGNFSIPYIQEKLGENYVVDYGRTKKRIYVQKNNKRLMIMADGLIVTYYEPVPLGFDRVPEHPSYGLQVAKMQIETVEEAIEIIKKIL